MKSQNLQECGTLRMYSTKQCHSRGILRNYSTQIIVTQIPEKKTKTKKKHINKKIEIHINKTKKTRQCLN